MPRATLAVVLLAACTPVEQHLLADVDALGDAVRDRIGVTLPPWRPATWTPGPFSAGSADTAELRERLAEGLTEDLAVRIALCNNPAVQAVYERLGVARASVMQASRWPNPILEANAKFFGGASEIEFGPLQPLLDVVLQPLRKRLATHEFVAARARVTRMLVHLTFAVRRDFVRVVSARRVVALHTQMRDVAAAAYELTQTLHRAGNVTDLQLTTEHAALLRARLELAAAEQAEREAREPLQVLLGLHGTDTTWRLRDGSELTPPSELHAAHAEARSVAASLHLAENYARAGALAAQVGIRDLEGVLSGLSIGPAVKKEVEFDWGFGPALRMALPLFDAGGARASAARAELRAALHAHTQLALEVRSAARVFRDRCAADDERVAFLSGVLLPVQARLVRETMQNYNAMQVGAFAVLSARRTELAAQLDYELALRAACLSRCDFAELLAGSINRAALAPRDTDRSETAGAEEYER